MSARKYSARPGTHVPPSGPNTGPEKVRVVLMINKGKGWKWVANGKEYTIMEKFHRWPLKEGEQLEVWDTGSTIAHRP